MTTDGSHPSSPTAEDFRALARSAPWLWDRLEARMRFTPGSASLARARSGEAPTPWEIHYVGVRGGERAQVTAPDGEVLQRGQLTPADRWGNADGSVMILGAADVRAAREAFARDRRKSWDQPRRRPDGLVARRPFWQPPDPPYFDNYHLVAILDPRELDDGQDADAPPLDETQPDATQPDEAPAHGTEVWDVRADTLHGRWVWWAKVRPTALYSPRCTCCALLPDTALMVEEFGAEHAAELGFTGPEGDMDHAEIALDRATGVVVRLHIRGGAQEGDRYEIDILRTTLTACTEPLQFHCH